MNKRGDITVTILVIGIVAVCFFALLTFYISELDTSKNFNGIGLIEKVTVRMEKGEKADGGSDIGAYLEENIWGRKHWYSLPRSKLFFEVWYYFP